MAAVTLRSRRDILRLASGFAIGALVGPGRAAASNWDERALSLYSINTGEYLTVEYFAEGCYQREALSEVNRLCRDHRTGEECAIDPRLLDQLFALRTRLGTREAYQLVCGYRSAETNALKRLHSHSVASNSYHLTGRAADVFLPDRDLRTLRRAALAMGAGGVGYYPRSGFVHLDTGPVRSW
ncbi:MAG TPA: DUF882 domain-containing protein [Candidatus Eisenbacteria bacterium]|nr:DUF882 domain-containing protein [Candidatus Eisenbacteria bacterium]